MSTAYKRLLIKLATALMLAIVLCVASCSTAKSVTKQHSQEKTEQKAEQNERSDSHDTSRNVTAITDHSSLSDDEQVMVYEVRWSAPDSCGHQYVLNTTATQRKRTCKRKADVVTSSDERRVTSDSSCRNETYIRNSDSSDKQKTASDRETQGWVYYLLSLLFLLLVAAGVATYRKLSK